MTEAVYWLNGRRVSAAEAVLPLNDHGLLYGDGVFEGIRFYNGNPSASAPIWSGWRCRPAPSC
jgi:branched-subunit amino acid aminotransferase/4-amino-4-deoxychorismate lyase